MDSVIVSRTTTYSGATPVIRQFAYRTVTCCGSAFQLLRLWGMNPLVVVLQPRDASVSVWALPCSLAATDGIDVSFFSCGYLDVSVLRVPSPVGVPVKRVGFPIRTSLSQCVSPARQGFSQVIASFVGSSARASTVDPYYLDRPLESLNSSFHAISASLSRGISRFSLRSSLVCHASRCRFPAQLPRLRLRKDTHLRKICQPFGIGCWLRVARPRPAQRLQLEGGPSWHRQGGARRCQA